MRARWLSLLLTAGLVLTACGPQSGAGAKMSPEEVVASAVRSTLDQGSAHVVIDARARLPESVAKKPFVVQGEGDFDFANRQGRATFELSHVPRFVGPEDVSGEVRFDRSAVYLKSDLIEMFVLLTGPNWVKVTRDALEDLLPGGPGEHEPSRVLSYLMGIVEVTESGKGEVGGVPTTRYDVTIDYERARRTAPESLRPAVDSIVKRLGDTDSPGEVWVDDEGLLRKVALGLTFDGSAVQGFMGGEARGEVTLTFGDFGLDVDVQPPPADRVTDLGRLLSRD
jgi:hypothetical protein